MEISVYGTILPNKALSNFEIEEGVRRLKIKKFRGVFMRDKLPNKPENEECGIFNLDDEGKFVNGKFVDDPPGRKGTHWVCWIRRNEENYYFDSFGLPPPVEIVEYFKRKKDDSLLSFNGKQIQPVGTHICGHCCLYILKKIQKSGSYNI